YNHSKRADVTISAVPRPIQDCSSLGVIQVDRQWRVTDFQEKPSTPSPIPGEPDMGLGSMGNYIFNTHILRQIIRFAHENDLHDFGRDIIPRILQDYKVYAYDFRTNQIPGMTEAERGYWRDVGTIDSYYESNMDLRQVSPIFNLYNSEWPIRTAPTQAPPGKFVFDDDGRRGMAIDSLVSEGCIISGSLVRNSVLSPNVFVHSYSSVDDSIVMSGVDIGRNCRIRRAIIDKYVKVPSGEVIGYDLEQDSRKYHLSPGGIVVIAKHTQICSESASDAGDSR
ncbi:MAG TPA: sugar phosphate nucleotidyltransferase, partial [bacterium]|nr:sugar phosphate nucleotidyltransferase [bacterium]